MLRPHLLLFVALALAPALPAQPITLINDTFADGERITQNLPSSLAWYVPGAAVSTLSVRNEALTLIANDNDRLLWGYFPGRTLTIGASLTLTVAFSFNRLAPASVGSFKVAICSTNGLAPKRADGGPPNGRYQGYASFTNPGDDTAGTRLRKRSGPAAANLTATLLELSDGDTNVVWDTFGAARTGLSGVLQANIRYRVVLKITRIGLDAMRVTTSISGGGLPAGNTMSEIDSANLFTAFDTIAIGAAETVQAGDLSIAQVELLHEIDTTRLSNLSILSDISAPGDTFTLGYVVGGSGTSGAKPLVIRAGGPSLGALGFPGTLVDPKIELFAGAAKTGENNNWGGLADVRDAMASVGAFAFASATSLDSAVLANITTSNNSVVVSSNDNRTGAVIAEIYDATPGSAFTVTTPRLLNVSVLKHLGTGVTIGFYVDGSGTKNVLVRAIGPTLALAPFNVDGTVPDPQLTLYSGQTIIATNDNWGGTTALTDAFTQIAAFPLARTSRDAALLAALAPGSYTVQVSGIGSTSGVALVEVYEVP